MGWWQQWAARVACSAAVAQHQNKAGLVLQGIFYGVTHNHPLCDFLPCCQRPSTALPPAGARQAKLKKILFYKNKCGFRCLRRFHLT